jgi:hypothetical protein
VSIRWTKVLADLQVGGYWLVGRGYMGVEMDGWLERELGTQRGLGSMEIDKRISTFFWVKN